MPYLDKPLRRQLANAIQQARVVAEEGAADAIRRLGVAEDKAPAHVSGAAADLRVKLRAHARSLGDRWEAEKKRLLSTNRLVETAAFEHWHRLLFGRFLVERGLLVHPDLNVAIARDDLAELAAEEGLPDEWALVERIAAPALPAVFKPEDPVLGMVLAPEYAKRLRDIVAGLPEAMFAADDSLGWTYQFWRGAEKDAVNRAGGKIGAAELPAVTQLFTEPYMVLFLLHNTLGAWWAGKVLAENPNLARDAAAEDALRAACALPGLSWEYLRFVRDGEQRDGPWRPAAGTFPGWPTRASEITFCDPCCGSGHFLVEGLAILAALRRREEGLSRTEAAQAVLRDNLHGLEIDGRCVQIAAFNVALAAWKLAGEPIPLPSPQIAWVGAPRPMSRTEMAALSDGDAALRRALEALHDQFAQAPVLGSLMEVGARDLLDADLRERGEAALAKLPEGEPERVEGAVAARGLLGAAALLGRRYVLLATNVPFLGRSKQDAALANYIAQRLPEAKADLATAMLQRMRGMAKVGGAVASVTPQNWLFLGGYKGLREGLLASASLSVVAVLGEHGFESNAAAGAFTALFVLRNTAPDTATVFTGLDASAAGDVQGKAELLRVGEVSGLLQAAQRANPDSRVTVEQLAVGILLGRHANSFWGQGTGDFLRFGRCFWEVSSFGARWSLIQSTVEETLEYGGRSLCVLWEEGRGALVRLAQELRLIDGHSGIRPTRGFEAWGKSGVAVSLMRRLPVTIYQGSIFDGNVAAIIPHDQNDLDAIWCFCSSPQFHDSVRAIDQKVNVVNHTLLKVPFDIEHWRTVAREKYRNGLPEPYSDDPAQWLFHGHPTFTAAGKQLHVALARLAGHRWPAETDPNMRLALLARERIALVASVPVVDTDGLLLFHATSTDRPLADRLRAYLAAFYGASLTPAREAELVRAADALLDKREARDTTLEGWLRDRAFRQHCVLFHQRPFLWHICDGLKDGFSAFLHYHRLNRAALEKLTYTLLGDWIARAKAEGQTARHERALQLQQRLVAILTGEAPYDIFVRWKPLARQPIGWEPDLDDGVRLNIRPFMTADVLREPPRGINWNKDRGTDVASAPWFYIGPKYGENEGARINDHHVTLAEKQAARAKAAE